MKKDIKKSSKRNSSSWKRIKCSNRMKKKFGKNLSYSESDAAINNLLFCVCSCVGVCFCSLVVGRWMIKQNEIKKKPNTHFHNDELQQRFKQNACACWKWKMQTTNVQHSDNGIRNRWKNSVSNFSNAHFFSLFLFSVHIIYLIR